MHISLLTGIAYSLKKDYILSSLKSGRDLLLQGFHTADFTARNNTTGAYSKIIEPFKGTFNYQIED